ncbi:MAG TPA: hypothetical protein VFW49_14840 [Fluviicoccus sp.]|nr:hypothetical protein [Fluviicoccus sp.]
MTAVTKVSPFSASTLGYVTGDCAGDVVVNEYFIDVTAAQIDAGNMFDVGILPAYHTVVDMILIPDDLDTGTPAITLDVGLLSGTPGDAISDRTIGAEFFSASTAAQGGTATRMSLASGFKVKPTESDRSIGVKVVADAATAAAGRIRLLCFMAPADHQVQF